MFGGFPFPTLWKSCPGTSICKKAEPDWLRARHIRDSSSSASSEWWETRRDRLFGGRHFGTGSLVRSLQSRQFGIICRERKSCRGSKVVSFSGKSRRYIAGRLAQNYTLDGRILRDRFNQAIACTSYDDYSRRVLTISPKTNMRPAVRFALFRSEDHYRTYHEQGSVWTRLVQ